MEEEKQTILCRQCEKPTDTPFGSCNKCREYNSNPNNPPYKKELQETKDNCIGEPFKEGFDPRRNYEGRPKETEETKIVRKAQKELIAEYKEKLTEALPLISPVLIAKAMEGDLGSIKELNDRVMGKAKETIDMQGGLKIEFAQDFNKNA